MKIGPEIYARECDSAEGIIEYADRIELHAVDFLDSSGNIGARGDAAIAIRFTFIDGRSFTISMDESEKLDNVHFNLRPVKNHA